MCLRALFVVSLAALLPVAHAAVPIGAFVEQQQFSHPRLSPDGKHLAVNVRIKRGDRTVPTMTIYSLPQLQIVSTIALPGFEIPVDFSWLTNRRLVVSKGLEMGVRQAPADTGEIVAVDIDGTRAEYLYGYQNAGQSSRGSRYGADQGYGRIVGIPVPRDGRVLVGAHEWDGKRSMLYEINSGNAVRKLLASLPEQHLHFVAQYDGKPRFAFGTDDQDNSVLFRLDDASGDWRKVVFTSPLGEFYPFAFTPDDRAFYASVSERGGPFKIVREDLRSGQRNVVAADPLGDIGDLQYTAYPYVPFAAASFVAVPKPVYIDDKLPEAQLHKTLSASFPDGYVDFINFSDDGKKLLFQVRSDRDPGSFYIYDRDSGKADLLLTNMPDIDPAEMAERRPVAFAARDGLHLTGFLTLPKRAGNAKMPLVLIPHGGPYGPKDSWFFDTDAQFLASRGYAVLQVNFRGSGGRGVGFKRAGYMEWGGKLIDDLADGVRWAATQPGIDASRSCAYGWSYGGYAALMLAARYPGMFKCTVGAAGVYYLPRIYDDERVKGEKGVEAFYTKVIGRDKATLEAISPSKLADKITIPVMLAHGGNDKVVPVTHSELMRDALAKTGRPAEVYMVVQNEGHGFYDSGHQKDFYLKLEAFLGKYIGK